jgi:Ca2+-transporting ATPase
MGLSGTEVAREAATMVLTDDHFSTIVDAVEEGRRVYDNIRKFILYIFAHAPAEVVPFLAFAASGGALPLPLTAVQILYVNLATDGLPALALAVDPPEADLMRRPPRDPRVGVFTRPVVAMLLTAGLWSGIVNIVLFTTLVRSGRPVQEAMALTFVTLVLIQFFNAYNCRSDRLSIIRNTFANRWLNTAVAWELVLLIAIAYVPFLQAPFGTFAFSPADLALSVALAFSIVPVAEAVKWFARRGRFGPLT